MTRDRPVAETSTWKNTTFTRDRHIPTPNGIRTHNPSKGAAADSHFRQHGHRDREHCQLLVQPQLNLLSVIQAAVSNYVCSHWPYSKQDSCLPWRNRKSYSTKGDKHVFRFLYNYENKSVTCFCLSLSDNKGHWAVLLVIVSSQRPK
jgi:hypothetical protein